MKTAERFLIALLIFGMPMIALEGCNQDKKAQTKAKKLPHVQVVAVEQQRMVAFLDTTGEVVAVNNVTMQSTVEGPIAFCPWREGDRVEQVGEKLIEIDRPMYRQEVMVAKAALSLAEAKLADIKAGARPEEIAQAEESVRNFENCTDFAKADLERVKSLVESGSLPGEMAEKARVDYVKCQTQLDAAKEQLAMLNVGPTKTEIMVAQASVDEADAKFLLAEAKLDECTLLAPFVGVVTNVFVRPGDLVVPRTPLLEMMDPSSVVVRFAVPESHVADMHEMAKATVRLDAYPDRIFNARIERIYPELQHNTRTQLVEAKVIDLAELLPGQFARISVTLRTIDDAIVVPDKAVVCTPQGDTIVFVVVNENKDGDKVCMRKVAVGLEQGQSVQILQGVTAGQLVVSGGNEKLKNGMQVEVIKTTTNPESKQPLKGDTK